MKRVNKLGLKDEYQNQADCKDVIRCLLGLPLLPAADTPAGLQQIRATVCTDMQTARQLQQLVTYVQRQWIDKRTVGPDRVSVRGVTSRTNNVLESYYAALRRRIQVTRRTFCVSPLLVYLIATL